LVVNLVLLFWPRSVETGGLPLLDKVVHATSFGLVMWSGLRAGLVAHVLGPLLAVHAVTSEAIQHYLLANRSGDPADVLADIAGVAGVALAWGAASWRHEHGGRHQRDADREPAGRDADPG
jgi:hypothetical protein